MLSKAKIKWINSLSLKKNRDEARLFVAEGMKIVSELLPVLKCKFLVYVEEGGFIPAKTGKIDEIELVSENELKKISSQKTPQGVIAVFERPSSQINISSLKNQLSLALDDIQDPGNLGTIIRLADWFGISDIFCSLHTTDIYNSKTIQSTMGAIARVRVHYVDLAEFLKNLDKNIPVYGTFMDGENIYENNLTPNGIIVMGNEGNGISEDVAKYISKRLLIPNFSSNSSTSESLNVSVATAITVAEFRRQAIDKNR